MLMAAATAITAAKIIFFIFFVPFIPYTSSDEAGCNLFNAV
jgi:hypothetical protein